MSSSSSENIGAKPPVEFSKTDSGDQTQSLKDAKPPSKIGDKADPEKGLKKLEGKGCTGGAVASALKRGGLGALRGLAGAVGIPLYVAATVIGGGASLAVFIGVGSIALAASVIGGGIGAAVGGALSLAGIGTAKEGAQIGATVGAIGFGLFPAVAAEVALALPKFLILNTVGRLGAGLTAFARTGKRESEQIAGRKEKGIIGRQSTNENLFNQLGRETFSNIILFDKLKKEL